MAEGIVSHVKSAKPERISDVKTEVVRNVPLKDSENDRARELVNLDDDLLVNPLDMSATAAGYFRERPWLTPDVCKKFRVGYLPNSGKSLLRGRVVYPMLSERGDVLSWFGRDPDFETKHRKWIQKGRPQKGEPMKTRFVKGFHRSLELFGQNAERLQEAGHRETIAELGIVVVEGPNDVMALDCHGIPAVGLCSNAASDKQIGKITKWAKQLGNGKVTMWLDCTAEGDKGAKEMLWKLSQDGDLNGRLMWSLEMFDGAFRGKQPEDMDEASIAILRDALLSRT